MALTVLTRTAVVVVVVVAVVVAVVVVVVVLNRWCSFCWGCIRRHRPSATTGSPPCYTSPSTTSKTWPTAKVATDRPTDRAIPIADSSSS